MLKNYVKIALRNIRRQREYSLLNITGLSVGLTISLLILLWVQDELKKDGFHEDGERIYRILSNHAKGEGGIETWERAPYPLLKYLPENYPEIERIGAYDFTNKKEFEFNNNEYLVDGIYASSSFFEILSFPLVEGLPGEIFQSPNAVVISEDLAARLFGSNWMGQAVGKTIQINGETGYTVSGVFADISKHSSLQFDFVLNLVDLHRNDQNTYPCGNYDSRILIKLEEGTPSSGFEPKIAKAIQANNKNSEGVELFLQPLERMYLYGQFKSGIEAGGRIEYVRIFSVAGIFLLLIACINFMNLATAQASRRAKEVGVRKTIGADRNSLIRQFMIEAALMTVISVIVAIFLGELLLPYFQNISGKELTFDFSSLELWGLILSVAIFTAFLSGSYPAFFLSSFRITNVLKGQLSYRFGTGNLRRWLVVLQFVLSAILVVGALVVQQQISFVRNKHLGLDKENVFYFRTPPGADGKLATFKEELLRIPGVSNLTFVTDNPLEVGMRTSDPKWQGMAPEDGQMFHVLATDHNFIKMMDIPIVEGRDFKAEVSSDTTRYIINETAARVMKLENPIGTRLEFWGTGGPIVGVVQDFHIGSLYEKIGPLIIGNKPDFTSVTMLRINPRQTEEVIAGVQPIFDRFSEGYPYRYDFMDERYLERYRSEERTNRLASWFAFIALFISCLGLLGLSAFIAQQRTKEIGIRKVLGATVLHIVSLLSRDHLKIVILSLVIALPVGWYIMNDWLQSFAYRIELSWWFFALAGTIAIAVALLTVGLLSLRAAVTNPVDSLRNEQ